MADGHLGKCKDCARSDVRQNRKDNIGYYREYDAHRHQEDPRVQARKLRYRQTEAGKASLNKSRKKWLDANQDKRAAHVILGNAVQSGRIKKPIRCSRCKEFGVRLHGHHDDYTLPLEVRWLCSRCHRKEHES